MKFFTERKRKKQLSELKALRRAEDDLLSPALRLRFDAIISELQDAPVEKIDEAVARSRTELAGLSLPHRGRIHGFLDLVIVVGLVAFGLRGLFFQPFRIPTGSMQPTLFGVHHQQQENNANPGFGKLPGILQNLIYGCSDADLQNGETDLQIVELQPASKGLFDGTALISSTGYRYVLPGNERQVMDYSKLKDKSFFAPGEKVSEGFVSLGDHLFVERVSMYLSPPERGDVIVFNTEGLYVDGKNGIGRMMLEEAGGYYYIKRLAALPGDTVKIVDNQLYVRPAGAEKFIRIQDLDKRFEKIYSMKGGYHGHLNSFDEKNYQCHSFALGEEFTIPEDEYLMLGDNSSFSMDSRYFGSVPRKNLIGRAWFVFYPFSRRLGAVDRLEPLDVPTGNEPGMATYPVMSLQ